MEFSKENIYKIGYAPIIEQETDKNKRWTSKFLRFIHKNKLLTTAIVIFIMCVTLNLILVYNFMRVLTSVY